MSKEKRLVAAAPVSWQVHQRGGHRWNGLLLRIPKHPGFTRFEQPKGKLFTFVASADFPCQKKFKVRPLARPGSYTNVVGTVGTGSS